MPNVSIKDISFKNEAETIEAKRTFIVPCDFATPTITKQNSGQEGGQINFESADGESCTKLAYIDRYDNNIRFVGYSSNDAVSYVMPLCVSYTDNRVYVTTPPSTAAVNDLSAVNVAWVNDPTLSINIVHKETNETIQGAKHFVQLTTETQAVSDNSTKVATTAYINNKFRVVDELPANPDPDVWYAILE